MYVMTEESPECNRKFSELFENIERSSSKAIAERVGSIKNNHIGKGHYLNPHNFSKEICLEYNLGPQHMMEGLCEEVYRIRQKEYVYKKDSEGRLLIEKGGMTVSDRDIGSAVKNFRINQIKDSVSYRFLEIVSIPLLEFL